MVYKMLAQAMGSMDFNKAVCGLVNKLPRNLRQHYADKIMLLHTEVEFGL